MKIDIHTHTKKCKSGDAHTREITPDRFCNALLSTDVRIVAITNHNAFDLTQYREIISILNGEAQVWPGVELDIHEGNSRGHLLVIVSPTRAESFSAKVKQITTGSTPDTFAATIDEVLHAFDELEPLYIAHYRQKKPNISDNALATLVAKTRHPSRVIKEVINSISAGIYISHGHPSIYGSDVHDWESYATHSLDLPDLRLPVDSFEHFCLLLEKDPTTINTALDRKTSEEVTLKPFGDDTTLELKLFNDINIVFGPKGTGKSCVLHAIAAYYSEKGIDARVYESAADRLDDIFDTKGRDLSIDLNVYGINYCTNEIISLRESREVDVTSVTKYLAYFKATTSNRNAKRILLKDFEVENEGSLKREFSEFNSAVNTTAAFLQFLAEDPAVQKELDAEEHDEVRRILSALQARLAGREWASFTSWKETCLLNSAIELFRREVARKTGSHAKPTMTGFREYARNRIKIERCAAEIIRNVDTTIPVRCEEIGSLGASKGILECRTEFIFQNGSVTDGTLLSLAGIKKGVKKKFVTFVRKILDQCYTADVFQSIAGLNGLEEVETIKTVNELVLFKRYFSLNGKPYSPSSGEASMVMLHKELEAEREVYILDEPERSLGNEYISDVIVPLIKERAKSGKTIVISTHDANIAVRTLPYSSVYRCHGQFGYKTYIGNPFANDLANVTDENDRLDWKSISMRTLEGGEQAFGERGKIYGND